MYKIYDLDYELFNTFTEEEKQDFFKKIKSQYKEPTIKWYLTNLEIYNNFLKYSIINP